MLDAHGTCEASHVLEHNEALQRLPIPMAKHLLINATSRDLGGSQQEFTWRVGQANSRDARSFVFRRLDIPIILSFLRCAQSQRPRVWSYLLVHSFRFFFLLVVTLTVSFLLLVHHDLHTNSASIRLVLASMGGSSEE